MKKVCLICKKEFKVTGVIRKSTAKYCSNKCKATSQKGKVPWVNKKGVRTNTGRTHFKKGQLPWSTGKKFSDEYKQKLSDAHLGKMMGELHWNWRGGLTPESLDRINDPKWKRIRKEIYKRDNWLCKVCHKHVTTGDIACHHKVPWRITKDDRQENLVTLCKSCHLKEDIKYRLNEDRMCAFTIIDDNLYYPEGTHIMINSFKRFHPDIDLIIFRQDMIDKVFKKKNINFFQAKPFFGEIVANMGYKVVLNLDADHVICGRLTEVFDKVNYDIGAAWNFNDYENASFENITEKMYLQAGMVSSTKKAFWLEWQKINKDAMKYKRKENDTLNLLVYNELKLKLKIFDKKKYYYGCKSLGREPEFYIKNNKLMCRKEQVLAYHFARGGVFPKLDFPNMPFTDEVKNWLMALNYGQTVKII